MAGALIGVDWGTSNFRAFLIGADGALLDRRSGPQGILSVGDGRFDLALTAGIGEWLAEGRLPILMSGMIGSRQGWVEAPYASAPAGAADLARALTRAPFDAADVYVVPGVDWDGPTMHDVMRGEETQVIGALSALGRDEGRFLLPGTHSKWVAVEGGRIIRFATYMTGEMFAAAKNHTILGRLMQDGAPEPDAFRRGVADGEREGTPGALLNRLFGVRTAGLFGTIAAVGLEDYLSGLLIGAELADQAGRAGEVAIVASDSLAERYAIAAGLLGIAATVVPSDCIVGGWLAIASMAGFTGGGR